MTRTKNVPVHILLFGVSVSNAFGNRKMFADSCLFKNERTRKYTVMYYQLFFFFWHLVFIMLKRSRKIAYTIRALRAL